MMAGTRICWSPDHDNDDEDCDHEDDDDEDDDAAGDEDGDNRLHSSLHPDPRHPHRPPVPGHDDHESAAGGAVVVASDCSQSC